MPDSQRNPDWWDEWDLQSCLIPYVEPILVKWEFPVGTRWTSMDRCTREVLVLGLLISFGTTWGRLWLLLIFHFWMSRCRNLSWEDDGWVPEMLLWPLVLRRSGSSYSAQEGDNWWYSSLGYTGESITEHHLEYPIAMLPFGWTTLIARNAERVVLESKTLWRRTVSLQSHFQGDWSSYVRPEACSWAWRAEYETAGRASFSAVTTRYQLFHGSQCR